MKHTPNSLPGLGSSSGWNIIPFVLSPSVSDSTSVDPHSDARLGTQSAWTGDSRALWHYWFNTCLEHHATCRSVEQRLQTYSPKRLVELILDDNSCLSTWRLVYSATVGTIPYFTLSHCWGSSQPRRLTKDNISLLSKPSPVYGLPETYRHALEIVNSLGYKYIWIDSLCIVQDDTKDWETEFSLMGLTYNHAVCNIAATWAADGGDGCFSTRDPTTVCPTFVTLGSKVDGSSIFQLSLARDFSYNEDITQAPLNQRGWVVQERYLARRQLSCAQRQLYWECHEVLASEEFPYGHPADDSVTSWPRLAAEGSPQKPCLDSNGGAHTRRGWAALVELYSGCQLTRELDKLVALSGLANQLQAMVDDVYIFGLWAKDLCRQICWKPLFRDGSSHRTTTQGRIAPTWSWANFDGPVIFDEAYYITDDVSKDWTEVAETLTDSTKRLTLRGLALKGGVLWEGKSYVLWEDEGDALYEDERHLRDEALYIPHLSFDRRMTPYIPASSSARVGIIWDEQISQDANPEEWSNFQKQRNSDLLFLVVRSWTIDSEGEAQGLILRMLPHLADDPVLYSRMGTFTVHDTRDHALEHVFSFLALHEGDTEDIMAAELIQAVTII